MILSGIHLGSSRKLLEIAVAHMALCTIIDKGGTSDHGVCVYVQLQLIAECDLYLRQVVFQIMIMISICNHRSPRRARLCWLYQAVHW